MLLTGFGWLVRTFWKSWQEARKGKKDEADKIADERDQAKRVATHYHNRKQRYKDVLWETRRVAIDDYHVPRDKLPDVPPDEPITK